jgi:hypothetical protein
MTTPWCWPSASAWCTPSEQPCSRPSASHRRDPAVWGSGAREGTVRQPRLITNLLTGPSGTSWKRRTQTGRPPKSLRRRRDLAVTLSLPERRSRHLVAVPEVVRHPQRVEATIRHFQLPIRDGPNASVCAAMAAVDKRHVAVTWPNHMVITRHFRDGLPTRGTPRSPADTGAGAGKETPLASVPLNSMGRPTVIAAHAMALPYDPDEPPMNPPDGCENRLMWQLARRLFGDHQPGPDGYCMVCRPYQFYPCVGR